MVNLLNDFAKIKYPSSACPERTVRGFREFTLPQTRSLGQVMVMDDLITKMMMSLKDHK